MQNINTIFLVFFFLTFFFLSLYDASIATFSVENSGIEGVVIVKNGMVIVDLDLSMVNVSLLPSTDCFDSGIRYHIHTKWEHNDTNDRIGSTECASSYTGGHYDPWVACSSSTGNEYCTSDTSSTIGCVDKTYSCNSTNYIQDVFACEVGDFSGKYGYLYLNNSNSSYIYRKDFSFWEVSSDDVIGLSIVFHCGSSNERAFCSVFKPHHESMDLYANNQPSNINVVAKLTSLSSDSQIKLYANGQYEINLDFNNIINNISCNEIIYRIYNSWIDSNSSSLSGNDSCSSNVGQVWDPTLTCLYGSESSYCVDDELCGDSNYTYYCDYEYERYYCSPSDLSGKYGIIRLSWFTSYISLTGIDHLLPPTDQLLNKSIVIECGDYSQKIACASFQLCEEEEEEGPEKLAKASNHHIEWTMPKHEQNHHQHLIMKMIEIIIYGLIFAIVVFLLKYLYDCVCNKNLHHDYMKLSTNTNTVHYGSIQTVDDY